MNDPASVEDVGRLLKAVRLLAEAEWQAVKSVLAPSFPFASQSIAASSLHLHIQIDRGALPSSGLDRAGWRCVLERPGFHEYRAAGSITVSFSSVRVSEDDSAHRARPVLDHIGFDLPETPDGRAAFDAVPAIAHIAGWGHAAQGGDGEPVHCCFAIVNRKHWAFPPPWSPGPSIEFSIGEVVADSALMGDDLRPAAPGCCGDGKVRRGTMRA